MIHMKRPIILLMIFFYLGVFCDWTVFESTVADAEDQNRDNISFWWAFGAVAGPEDSRKLIPIARKSELTTGDKFKMFVELRKQDHLQFS